MSYNQERTRKETDEAEKFVPAQVSGIINDRIAEVFQEVISNMEFMFQILDAFPYTIKVFNPKGFAVFINRNGGEERNRAGSDVFIRRYNIKDDPLVNDTLGLGPYIKRAFQGEKVTVSDVGIPLEGPLSQHTPSDKGSGAVMYQDITCFPVWDKQKHIKYIVMVFFTKQTYSGRADIVRTQEYIHRNWREDFDMAALAHTANLSISHFQRKFKQHTGYTPLEYYKQIKVKKLKEKLCDPNLNIGEAFAICGIDYHGNYARYFKKVVGMTPSGYRAEKLRKA